MKQVLFIGMSPSIGGIETFMMNIFMKLEGHGFHFTFINTSKNKLAYQDKILRNGGTIKRVLINNSLFGHLFRYRKALSFFKRNHNYDIVHLNAVTVNVLFWIKAANKFHINKLIIHSHNDGIIYNSLMKKILAYILTWINIKYLNNHHNIYELAVSKDSGIWMFHNNRFKVVRNGIDPNIFKFNSTIRLRLRRKLGIKEKDKVLITVARLEAQKNYYRIIRIFYRVHKIIPYTKLVIVGDGSEKQALINYVEKLRLSSNVIFLGAINDVYNVLNIADLMIMPSKYEGFPFSLIESQSTGVPAVVSKEAVPISSNVTGTLKYLSLNKSDEVWSNVICHLLRSLLTAKVKLIMNEKIRNSKYNVNDLIKTIYKLYKLE